MSSLTAAQIQTKLTAIDAAIDTIISDPTAYVNYKIGDKSIDKGNVLKELRETRNYYEKLLQNIPYESIDAVEINVSSFGEDKSEILGEPTS